MRVRTKIIVDSIKIALLVTVALAFALVYLFTRVPGPTPILGNPPAQTNEIVWTDTVVFTEIIPSSVLGQTQAIQWRVSKGEHSVSMEGVEAAERHNLYQMQRYQQQMLRRLKSETTIPWTE